MHHSVESMRDRAFLKGRTAFRSDAEYNAALRGEIDDLDEAVQEQREDRAYELALEILGSANKGELEDIEWFVAASMSDTMTPDNPFFVEGDGGEETFQLSELPNGRVRLERLEDNKTVDIETKALADAVEELSEKMDAKATEEPEDNGMAGHYADPVEAAEAFRDVLNGTPSLEEDDLDCIARRLKGFRDGTTGELLVFAGHFTLKPAEISARKVVIVVNVRGEFAVEIDDALGVVSEIAKAMECADREPPEEDRENPVLTALFDEIEDAEMDELPDFLSNDKYGDIDLNCGKSLKWRDGVLPERKLVVIDDPDQQNWSMVSKEEFADAFAKACSQRRLEKLEEMLDCLPDAMLDKIIGTARQVVANGYSVGICLEHEDGDGQWVADIKVLPGGRVRFETDDGAVEVLGKELLETAEAARGRPMR